MSKKISALKLNIITILFLWSLFGGLGILKSLELSDNLFFIVLIPYAFLVLVILYLKYKPFINKPHIFENYILFGKKYVYGNNIIKTFEINPFEKILFAAKKPENDFSTCFFKKGVVIKTLYGSYLCDNTCEPFIHFKKVRVLRDDKSYFLYISLLYIFPPLACTASYILKIDTLFYVLAMAVFVFVLELRIVPAFYLGKKLGLDKLPLSYSEREEFKSIIIIEGFAMSDSISVMPFTKPLILDGLALNIIIKKYIVINPRLFKFGSKDYLRFVLFHELSHIKHNDNVGAIILTSAAAILEVLFYMAPSVIKKYLPYLDYGIIGSAILYFTSAFINRKKIEKRADVDGIGRIGNDGVENIKKELGVDFSKML